MKDKEFMKHLDEFMEHANTWMYDPNPAPTNIELGPTEADPYQGAYDFKFTQTYNGLLTPNELNDMGIEWWKAVQSLQPLTRGMTSVDNRPKFWATTGGLSLQLGGSAIRAFDAIVSRWYEIADMRALDERRDAGWSGPRFLTTPSGVQKGPNGQYFGSFTRP